MSASALRRFNIVSILNLSSRTRYWNVNCIVEQFAEDVLMVSGPEWRNLVIVNCGHGSRSNLRPHLTVRVSTDAMRAQGRSIANHVFYWPGAVSAEGAYQGFEIFENETPDPKVVLTAIKNNTGKWNGSLFKPVEGGSIVAYSVMMNTWYVVDEARKVVPVKLDKEGDGWVFIGPGGGKVTALFPASVPTPDQKLPQSSS